MNKNENNKESSTADLFVRMKSPFIKKKFEIFSFPRKDKYLDILNKNLLFDQKLKEKVKLNYIKIKNENNIYKQFLYDKTLKEMLNKNDKYVRQSKSLIKHLRNKRISIKTDLEFNSKTPSLFNTPPNVKASFLFDQVRKTRNKNMSIYNNRKMEYFSIFNLKIPNQKQKVSQLKPCKQTLCKNRSLNYFFSFDKGIFV